MYNTDFLSWFSLYSGSQKLNAINTVLTNSGHLYTKLPASQMMDRQYRCGEDPDYTSFLRWSDDPAESPMMPFPPVLYLNKIKNASWHFWAPCLLKVWISVIFSFYWPTETLTDSKTDTLWTTVSIAGGHCWQMSWVSTGYYENYTWLNGNVGSFCMFYQAFVWCCNWQGFSTDRLSMRYPLTLNFFLLVINLISLTQNFFGPIKSSLLEAPAHQQWLIY